MERIENLDEEEARELIRAFPDALRKADTPASGTVKDIHSPFRRVSARIKPEPDAVEKQSQNSPDAEERNRHHDPVKKSRVKHQKSCAGAGFFRKAGQTDHIIIVRPAGYRLHDMQEHKRNR